MHRINACIFLGAITKKQPDKGCLKHRYLTKDDSDDNTEQGAHGNLQLGVTDKFL